MRRSQGRPVGSLVHHDVTVHGNAWPQLRCSSCNPPLRAPPFPTRRSPSGGRSARRRLRRPWPLRSLRWVLDRSWHAQAVFRARCTPGRKQVPPGWFGVSASQGYKDSLQQRWARECRPPSAVLLTPFSSWPRACPARRLSQTRAPPAAAGGRAGRAGLAAGQARAARVPQQGDRLVPGVAGAQQEVHRGRQGAAPQCDHVCVCGQTWVRSRVGGWAGRGSAATAAS